KMVARLYDTFYDAKATLLSEADIKEIRESRSRIPNASKIMAKKFHIGPKRIYKIWDYKERLQQGVILSQSNPKKNSQKGKVKIDEKLITEATSMVKKNNKNNIASSSDNSSDTSREDRLESLLENLVKHGKKLKSLTVDTSDISSI
ncbi:35137_t:CDS:2, partial [Racocetra persica]